MEHHDEEDRTPVNAGEVMRRLLDGEAIPCGDGRSYKLIRGHLMYVYDRIGGVSVPVDGFPNALGMEGPDMVEMLSITKERAIAWIYDNLLFWRH